MGTEIQRRGGKTRLPLWSARALIESPELVLAIHREEVSAGAEVLTANTFRTHRRTLEKAGVGARAGELTGLAVALARQAARESGRRVFVAGSLSPLEDCYRPDLAPEDAAIEREHAEQAQALAGAGADLILAETHNTVRELCAAVRAAKVTGLPVVASVVTDGKGNLLSGEPIEEAVRALAPLRPEVLSINCVPAARLAGDLYRLAAASPGIPLAAYGNLGLPADDTGWVFTESLTPEEYAGHARGWLEAGTRLVGGCCGTTPSVTSALAKLCDQL
jgi:S-methylmethionine-dependent homocysteine/selenocysteine methylase